MSRVRRIAQDGDGGAAPVQTQVSASVAASTKATGLVLAIDPGPTESGYVVFDGERVIESGTLENDAMLYYLRAHPGLSERGGIRLAIEMVASFGMPVGRDVFDTVRWVGRFQEAWCDPDAVQLVYRQDVKMHLCYSMKAKDANIRASLIDRFGPGKSVAIGSKRQPGPLYGVSGHSWAALAVAVYATDVGVKR